MQKSENKFKELVCSLFTKYATKKQLPYKIIKHNDPTNIGMADLEILMSLYKPVFAELKHVTYPISYRGNILKHPFSEKQISFLKQITKCSVIGIGIIGVEEVERSTDIYIVHPANLKTNFTLKELKEWDMQSISLTDYSYLNKILQRD